MNKQITTASAIRSVFRNRVKRHKDALLVAQYMQAEFGHSEIGRLKAPELRQVAAQFNVAVPDAKDAAEYIAFSMIGHTHNALLGAVDKAAAARGVDLSNLNPVGASAAVAGGGGFDDAEADDTEADDEAPEAEAAPAQPEAQPSEADQQEAAATADVKAVLQTFSNDPAKFKDALHQLALRANAPAQIIVQPSVSPLASGRISKRLKLVNMRQAGINAPVVNAKLEATELALYDHGAAVADLDADYIWPDCTAYMLAQCRRGRNVWMFGPAGTGKSSFPQQLAARLGREFFTIACDDQTDSTTILGMTVPTAEGGTEWQDGALTAAIRKPGAVILIDEPTAARPGALMVFQSLLASRKLHIPYTGEVVSLAPDAIVFAADNTNATGDQTGRYEGAGRQLNYATADRFSSFVEFAYMPAADEARAIAARSGCTGAVADQLVKFANLTRVKFSEGTLSHPIGLRKLVYMAEQITDGAGAAFAFAGAMLNGSAPEDIERLRQCFQAEFNAAAAGCKA